MVAYCHNGRLIAVLIIAWLAAMVPLAAQEVEAPPVAEQNDPAPEQPDPAPAPTAPKGRLPWDKTDTGPVKRIESPRDLLDNFGVQQSDLFNFLDEQPLNDPQLHTVLRILYNVQRFRPQQIEQWRRPLEWPDIVKSPGRNRAELFPLSGVVKRIERFSLTEEQSLRFDMTGYYVAQFWPNDAPYVVQLYFRNLPESWQVGEPVSYTTDTDALFIKFGESDEEMLRPIFVAKHLVWRPKSTEESPSLTPELIFLAENGVDVGEFAAVRKLNTHRMDKSEHDAFYQVLAAARDIDPQDFERHATATLDLAELLQNPQNHHGEMMWLRGSAQKITRVEVSEGEIHAKYGLDHYYQIDLFLPLQNQQIVLGGTEGEEAPTYRSEFPAVIQVVEVTPELAKLADQAQEKGELLDQEIVIPVIFYRLWSYRSPYVSQFSDSLRQPAPMFVGVRPQMSEPYKPMSPYVGAAIGGLFIVALGVLWIGVWRFNRSDNRFERETLKPKRGVAKGVNLNELGIEASDGPDFSHLNGK